MIGVGETKERVKDFIRFEREVEVRVKSRRRARTLGLQEVMTLHEVKERVGGISSPKNLP